MAREPDGEKVVQMSSSSDDFVPEVTTVDRAEMVAMLRTAATEKRISLERFYELGRRDLLDDPELRDLWLIWGHLIEDGDLRQVV